MRKLFIFCCILLLASSCAPSLEKAISTATKTQANATTTQNAIHAAWPSVTADFAHRVYAPKAGETIKGKEQVSEKTTTEPPVTVPCKDEQGQPVQQVECPPAKVTIRTVYRTDTLRVIDTAAQALAQIEVDTLEAKLIRAQTLLQNETSEKLTYKEERNKAYGALAIIAAIFVGVMILVFFRKMRITSPLF
ncbi:hypothetical protein I2I11_04265 [Pontibacter sp. 172403-2]|uniref:hypothetical protein n=1 Tax=Pontibacter rufus TaxID=2791028 RepID=UPI0018AF9793|nr:hypothetical protein [Pontibacter sp. 172403-2]MBF9252499.1 hypothetical protein [Pontibacter sp. 172403-2]